MSNKTKGLLIILTGVFLAAIGAFASVLLSWRFQTGQAFSPVVIKAEAIQTERVIGTRELFLGGRRTQNAAEADARVLCSDTNAFMPDLPSGDSRGPREAWILA